MTAAIVVVTIPAEHADEHKAGTNGKPGNTKVKGAKLIEHISTFLIKGVKSRMDFLPLERTRSEPFPSKLQKGNRTHTEHKRTQNWRFSRSQTASFSHHEWTNCILLTL